MEVLTAFRSVSSIKTDFEAQAGWQKPLRLYLKPFDYLIQLVPVKNMLNKVNILIKDTITDEGKELRNNEIVLHEKLIQSVW